MFKQRNLAVVQSAKNSDSKPSKRGRRPRSSAQLWVFACAVWAALGSIDLPRSYAQSPSASSQFGLVGTMPAPADEVPTSLANLNLMSKEYSLTTVGSGWAVSVDGAGLEAGAIRRAYDDAIAQLTASEAATVSEVEAWLYPSGYSGVIYHTRTLGDASVVAVEMFRDTNRYGQALYSVRATVRLQSTLTVYFTDFNSNLNIGLNPN